LFFVATDIAA